MASVAHSIETLLAQWLPPKTTNPPLAPTTSAFGILDEDALLLIAHSLVPLPTDPWDWLSARDQALRNLNALVRSCRFWRDAFDGICQSVRLEAIALASPCVPPTIARNDRPNGNVGALFEQLLAQACVDERQRAYERIEQQWQVVLAVGPGALLAGGWQPHHGRLLENG